jgi:hypothetical protein
MRYAISVTIQLVFVVHVVIVISLSIIKIVLTYNQHNGYGYTVIIFLKVFISVRVTYWFQFIVLFVTDDLSSRRTSGLFLGLFRDLLFICNFKEIVKVVLFPMFLRRPFVRSTTEAIPGAPP